jgi:hypothetical protein
MFEVIIDEEIQIIQKRGCSKFLSAQARSRQGGEDASRGFENYIGLKQSTRRDGCVAMEV